MPVPAYAEPEFVMTNMGEDNAVMNHNGEGLMSQRGISVSQIETVRSGDEYVNSTAAKSSGKADEVTPPVLYFDPLPLPFCNIQITMNDLKENINSEQSFQHAVDMICKGSVYILTGPLVERDELRFRVKSETDSKVSYVVCIKKKGSLTTKFKETFKNFYYKCQCPVKKVGSIILRL